MTKREQIIEAMSKIGQKLDEWEGHPETSFNDDRVRIGRARLIWFIKSFIADEILALPLDIPSDEIRRREQSEYNTMQEERAFYEGWKRAIDEIKRRNK